MNESALGGLRASVLSTQGCGGEEAFRAEVRVQHGEMKLWGALVHGVGVGSNQHAGSRGLHGSGGGGMESGGVGWGSEGGQSLGDEWAQGGRCLLRGQEAVGVSA